MLSRASVDQRFTGTDSSMKLSRFSVSDPLCRWSGGLPGALDLDPPSRRLRSLPSRLRGRVTAEGEIKLPPIFSPNPFGRNDFRVRWRQRGGTGGLGRVPAVSNLPDRAPRVVGDVEGAVGTLG